jgi:hypothetical protein
MNLRKLVHSYQKRFARGIQLVQRRRDAWTGVEKRSKEIFEAVVRDARKAKMFDHLYCTSPADQGIQTTLGYVSLFWGSHLIAHLANGKESIEYGCGLHVAQDYRGWVFAYVTPFVSDLHGHSPAPHPLLINVFRWPGKPCDWRLRRYVRVLFSLAVTTSFCGKPSGWDRVRVYYLRLNSAFMAKGLPMILRELTKKLITTLAGKVITVSLSLFI